MSSAAVPAPGGRAALRSARRGPAALVAGSLLVLVLVALSAAVGARRVALTDVLDAWRGGADGLGQAAVLRRLPRTALALLVGAALGCSGATMQAITRNPLADPGILGVSNGAALAVVVGITFFGLADPYGYVAVAIVGAFGAAAFVYVVGSAGRGGATPLKLALAGAATSAACSSAVSAVLLPRVDVMERFRFWQLGGVGGATWERIGVVAPFLAVGVLLCALNARGLNALALGDDLAAGLGADVVRTRVAAAAGAVLLCGAATAVAGPIAFVGLVVPHVCRALVGADHRWLLPSCALGGAALLVAGDVVGRVVARPEEVEVGVVTAVIGAPVLLWVVGRERLQSR